MSLCQKYLPNNEIEKIKYFIAHVSSSPQDPQKSSRQKTYIRALKSHIPEFEVYYGQFNRHKVRAPLVTPINGKNTVEIYKTEEKGSDVNLAVHILNDAWRNRYDCAVIITNDGDIAEALKLTKEIDGKLIGILSPVDHPLLILKQHANFVKKIRSGALATSQLPRTIPNTTISKPADW